MPARSKFTAERRNIILEALRRGNTRRTAAGLARVDPAQVTRWVKQGEESPPGSKFREFAEEVAHAESVATGEMVEIVRRDATTERNVKSAMWWLERRASEFRSPSAYTQPPQTQAPVVINLAFADGTPLQPIQTANLAEVAELESGA